MILAGDIGGTKALIGLFATGTPRPRSIHTRSFPTAEYSDLKSVVAEFLAEDPARGQPIEAACFGVAGPVFATRAELTNVPFAIDADAVASAFGIPRVSLLNDLQATACAALVLEPSELHVLQPGTPMPGGNIGVIAAGTGINEAVLQTIRGRFIPMASEAGHADWAARTDRDIAVLRSVRERYGRTEIEHVLSGQGLVNLHRATHTRRCVAVSDLSDPDAPAAISTAALEQRCPQCEEALGLFVEAYGAESGNLALRAVTTGGLLVGGGIAPKILPALSDGRFMDAFLDKGTFRAMVARIPVSVILNPEAALIGAAVIAAQDHQ